MDFVDRFGRSSNRFGGLEICVDAEPIRSLIVKEMSRLVQAAGDLLIDRMHVGGLP
jgi:hypothetical protein